MTIIIQSKRDGFRRCGVAHPSKPTKYADDFFTEEQLKALAKEPQLICAYEEDEFDQVQDEPDEDFLQGALSQASDTSPATQSQASETVIEALVDTVPASVGEDPGIAGAVPALGDLNEGSAGPLSGQAPEAAPAQVDGTSNPIQEDSSEPAAKSAPGSEKTARVGRAKEAAK